MSKCQPDDVKRQLNLFMSELRYWLKYDKIPVEWELFDWEPLKGTGLCGNIRSYMACKGFDGSEISDAESLLQKVIRESGYKHTAFPFDSEPDYKTCLSATYQTARITDTMFSNKKRLKFIQDWKPL